MRAQIRAFNAKTITLALCHHKNMPFVDCCVYGGGGGNFSPQKYKVGALDEKSTQAFKARTLENE